MRTFFTQVETRYRAIKDCPFAPARTVLPRSERNANRIGKIQGNTGTRKSRYRCTTIQATRANYHGNTPRRTY